MKTRVTWWYQEVVVMAIPIENFYSEIELYRVGMSSDPRARDDREADSVAMVGRK
jgi:hypothetical protein